MADVKKLAQELTKLTVLEVNELKNILKDEYGIEPAAAAVAVAGPAAGGDAGALQKTKRLNSPLRLKTPVPRKSPSSKLSKNSPALALVRLKVSLTTFQVLIKEKVSKEDAEAAKSALEAAGAAVELS